MTDGFLKIIKDQTRELKQMKYALFSISNTISKEKNDE